MGGFRVLRWALLFVVLVIFASGAVAFYTVFFDTADDIIMPPLRSTSVQDAMKELERLGFSARAVKVEQIVSSLAPGQVLTQSPEAGTRARKNTSVILHVSKMAARRAAPEVRGLVVAQAQTRIQEQGFEVGDILYIKDDTRPVGTVIAQSPAAPANIPGDRKIDLLVNQSAGTDGRFVVPDVAQMTERQARDLLAASGLRVAAVDSVYSPNATAGYVISTRPEAGRSVRFGEGIRLRVATAQKPAGIPEPPQRAQTPQTAAPAGGSSVTITIPGQGQIVVSDPPANAANTPPAASQPANQPRVIQNPVLQSQQSQPPAAPSVSATTTPAPAAPVPSTIATSPAPAPATTTPSNLQPVGGKVARIRYQVPPLTRALNLKIELADPSGTKILLDRNARSGEYVSLDAPYSRECAVTIYLGGEFVWQDRYM